jgi:hypothetical protein
MSEAPERIWIEDEFGEGDDDQWVYGTWDVRHYAGYNVEYVRADHIKELEVKLAQIEGELLRRVKHAEDCKKAAGSGTSQRREHYRMHALSEALGAVRKIINGEKQ